MKKILKITLKVLMGLVLVAVLGYVYLAYSLDGRIRKVYAIEPQDLTVNLDKTMLEDGAHLYKIKGCEDCHGADLGGKEIMDDPAVGYFAGSNITYGKGGLPQSYTSKDWVRALRHGLNQEGMPLLIMPSQETYKLSDKDVAALIAYCMNQPPVDREVQPVKLRPLGTVLSALDQIPLLSAEKIDHDYEAPDEIEALPNATFGQYLAVSCSGCHKANFKGGEAEVPGMKPYPDITASGNIGRWSEGQFISTLRTGRTPEGKQLKNEEMPWQMTKAYTDTELKALYAFLKSK